MRNVFFEPWVGANYGGGLYGKKILIIGETHYCENPDDCDCEQTGDSDLCKKKTRLEVESQLGENSSSNSVYAKIAKMLLGKESNKDLSEEEKKEFWHSVAFYNYVQISGIKCSQLLPTKDMWDLSEKAFHEVIEVLAPDFILVLGEELWNNLPGQDDEETDWPIATKIQIGEISEQTWYYKAKSKNILAMPIYLPSGPAFSHLSYNYNPIILKAIEIA